MSSKRVQRKELDIISYHKNPILKATQVKQDKQIYIIGLDRKQLILWGHPMYNKKLYLKACIKNVTSFTKKARYTTMYFNKTTKVLFVGRTDGILDILQFKQNQLQTSEFAYTLEYQLSVNILKGNMITDIIEIEVDSRPYLLVSGSNEIAIIDNIYNDSIDVFYLLKLEKQDGICNLNYFVKDKLLIMCDKNYQMSFFELDFSQTKQLSIKYLTMLSQTDGHRGYIGSAAYDSNLKILVTGGQKNVCVWSTNTLQEDGKIELLFTMTENIGMVSGLAFCGAELLGITCDHGGAVIISDLNKNVVVGRFMAHYGACNGLELDAPEGLLLTWGDDRLLKLWRLWDHDDVDV